MTRLSCFLFLLSAFCFPLFAAPAPRSLDPKAPTPVPIPGGFLNLERCYELALLRMETIGLSDEDIRVAQARYWQAVGAALPSLKIIGEQAIYNDRLASFGVNSAGGPGTSSIDDTPRSARVNLKVPLFSGLRDLEIAKAARAEIAGARHSRARLLQNLYLDVAEAFYQVLQYEDDLAILTDIELTLTDRVADQERRVRLGKSRESELIQARNALAQTRVAAERTRGLLGSSRELLLFYIGIPAAQLHLRDTAPPPPHRVTLADYLDRIGQRPDILASLEAGRSARAQLSAAKGAHWPKISFEGNYYAYDSDNIQTGEWNGFLTVELPLFEGGSIEAKVNENKALFAQSQLDLSKLQREAVRDVRTAWNNFNSSIAELARLEEATATAQANYQAQLADYDLGVVNSLEVLDALQTLHDTRRDYATARLTTRLNLIRLHITAGQPPAAPSQTTISKSPNP
jgi:outer membrane protein